MGSLKPGRNDLCPCGSGKKYKKCCLGRRTNMPNGNGGGVPGSVPQEGLVKMLITYDLKTGQTLLTAPDPLWKEHKKLARAMLAMARDILEDREEKLIQEASLIEIPGGRSGQMG